MLNRGVHSVPQEQRIRNDVTVRQATRTTVLKLEELSEVIGSDDSAASKLPTRSYVRRVGEMQEARSRSQLIVSRKLERIGLSTSK
jgi:hypothetical protein